MSTRNPAGNKRPELLDSLRRVGREHSDATVIFHATIARSLGLNTTDEKAMSILERSGPLTAGELANSTGLATASVTELIDRLERKGFVRRARDPNDRRQIIVEPASDRISRIAPLFESTTRSLGKLFGRYTNEELAIILDFFERNAQRLRAETVNLDFDRGRLAQKARRR